jgi:hypothetical protein
MHRRIIPAHLPLLLIGCGGRDDKGTPLLFLRQTTNEVGREEGWSRGGEERNGNLLFPFF